MDDRVEELAFENSYLRGDLWRLEECYRQLLDMKSKIAANVQMMEEVLKNIDQRLQKINQDYLKVHQIDSKEMESGKFI
jgi:diketogulonate reductase-like aldo/keto reductase